MADDDLSPQLSDLARRPSGQQQWLTAIAQQHEREARKPSMGQQLGDIVNWNIGRAVHGNPLAMIASMYQNMREGGDLDPAMGIRTAAAMALEGMPYAQRGALGTGGGRSGSRGPGQPSDPPLPSGMPPGYLYSVPPRFVRYPAGTDERLPVIDKLLYAGDLVPTLRDNRMWFKSLSPAENEIMNRIGWSRSPHVTHQDELSPLTSRDAWFKNLVYWRVLARNRT